MASAFTHALVAAVISSAFWRPASPVRFWVIGIACSVVPDLDVVGFGFGIAYGDILGHRGLTHSLAFAAALATIAERLARGPTFALGMTKELLNQELHMSLDQAIEGEAQAQQICMQTADFKEAYAAFVGKRDAQFQGR